jgi:hypothetical protein
VNGLRADDSAIYTCKATNLLGEAVSTCTLKVEGSNRTFVEDSDFIHHNCVLGKYNEMKHHKHLLTKYVSLVLVVLKNFNLLNKVTGISGRKL